MRLGANNKDTPKYYLIAQQGPVQPAISWKSEILNDFSFKLDTEGGSSPGFSFKGEMAK